MNELLALIAELKTKANGVLAGLPPIEQYEATSEIAYGIRSLEGFGRSFTEALATMTTRATEIMASIDSKAAAAAAVTAETELLAKGLHMLKADSEAAVSAAADKARDEERIAVTAELQKASAIVLRRAALLTDKELPAVTAEKISDDVLGAADCDAQLTILKGRVGKLTGLGLKPEGAPLIFGEAAGFPMTAEGDTAFETRLLTLKEAMPKGGKPANLNPAAGAGGAPDATRSRVSRLI